jgi:dihydrofolate reductase
MSELKVNFIYARSDNDVIGNDNQLPWRIPGDLGRFKALTEGAVVVMGRKTWDSLPKKPLANRINIVLTKQPAPGNYPDTIFAASIGRVMEVLRWYAKEKPVWVIGGAMIYKEFEGLATRVYETVVRSDKVVGEAHYRFPRPTLLVSSDAAQPCLIDGEEVQVDNLVLEVIK